MRANAPWLAAGFLLTFASSFGQTFFISIFAGEIRGDFGLSHASWGLIFAVATMSSAAVMVWAGILTDRFRVRLVGLAGLAGLGLAATSMVWIREPWMLLAALFLLRLFGQGLMVHAAMVAMARWFTTTRGRAVTLAGLGVFAGEAVLPVTFVALKGMLDWRSLWLVAAGILLALIPVLWSLLRLERVPQDFVRQDGSAGMHGRMWTRAEVCRHAVFWLMLPALLGPAAWNTALFFHQVHLAEAKGWAHVSLVSLFPLFTATSVTCMLGFGWLVDRGGSTRLAMAYLIPSAVGYLVLALAGSVPAVALAVILMGAGIGMHVTMMATFWAEVFGTRHLGTIRAMMSAIMVLGTALGPAISGALIDAGLDFPTQCFGIAAWFAVAAVLAGRAGKRATQALA